MILVICLIALASYAVGVATGVWIKRTKPKAEPMFSAVAREASPWARKDVR